MTNPKSKPRRINEIQRILRVVERGEAGAREARQLRRYIQRLLMKLYVYRAGVDGEIEYLEDNDEKVIHWRESGLVRDWDNPTEDEAWKGL
jgi:hypothetical protein